MFLNFNRILKYIKENSSKYYNKLKNIFFKILINSWFFWVLIVDLESLRREDLEYIGIFWIFCVSWLWEKEESFFFFSIEIEIKRF